MPYEQKDLAKALIITADTVRYQYARLYAERFFRNQSTKDVMSQTINLIQEGVLYAIIKGTRAIGPIFFNFDIKYSELLAKDISEDVNGFFRLWTKHFDERKVSNAMMVPFRAALRKQSTLVKSKYPKKGSQSKNPNTLWVRTGLSKKSIVYKSFKLYKIKKMLGLVGGDNKISTDKVTYRRHTTSIRYKTKIRWKITEYGAKFRPKKHRGMFMHILKKELYLRKRPPGWGNLIKKVVIKTAAKRQKHTIKTWEVNRKHVPAKILHLVEYGFYNRKAKRFVPGYGYANKSMLLYFSDLPEKFKEGLKKMHDKLVIQMKNYAARLERQNLSRKMKRKKIERDRQFREVFYGE